MRILIISQFFPPDITAAAFRVGDVVKHLREAGHDVTVFTARPHKGEAVDDPGQDSEFSGIEVHRTRLRSVGRGGLVSYLRHYLSFMFGSIWHGVVKGFSGWRPEVLWASSPPLFAGLSGRVLSVFYRCPLVLDIRDIWPECAVSAGQMSADGVAFRIGKFLEKHLYTNAKHITCVARPMRDYITAHTGVPISVIYNGVPSNGDLGAPQSRPSMRARNRVLLYAGNIGRVQSLDLLIRAWAEIAADDELADWTIRLIGSGAVEDKLTELVARFNLGSRVRFDPPMTREAVMREIADADLLYLSLKGDDVLKMTIPSKLFDYMLAGRPIVAGLAGEGREILESTGANLCHDPGDLDQTKRAIREGISRYSELARVSERNRTLVLKQYRRQDEASALLTILEGVAEKTEKP